MFIFREAYKWGPIHGRDFASTKARAYAMIEKVLLCKKKKLYVDFNGSLQKEKKKELNVWKVVK